MSTVLNGITATTPVTNGTSSRGTSPLQQPPAADPASSTDPPMNLQQAVSSLNDYFGQQKPPMTFFTTREQGNLVVQIFDNQDNTVVRQIPAEEAVSLATNLSRGNATLMSKQTA
jgi:flagellar protein FlaG